MCVCDLRIYMKEGGEGVDMRFGFVICVCDLRRERVDLNFLGGGVNVFDFSIQ